MNNLKVSNLLNDLIDEGKVIKSECRSVPEPFGDDISFGPNPPEAQDIPKFKRWANKVVLLQSRMGDSIKAWTQTLETALLSWEESNIDDILAVLETIRFAIDGGLLATYEDLLYAEAFGDLTEQGQHLFSQGYFLAAGVVFRAVLEEHLRRLCEKHQCTPEKERPTINDLNTALYRCDPPVYNKSVMMQVTALAAVGNDAAHNKPELAKEDVKRLQDGLLDFLARFSE